jgi:hypothetical protein
MLAGLLALCIRLSQCDQPEARVQLAQVAGIGGDDGLVTAARRTPPVLMAARRSARSGPIQGPDLDRARRPAGPASPGTPAGCAEAPVARPGT